MRLNINKCFSKLLQKYFGVNYENIEDDWINIRNKKPIEIKIN